MADRISYRLPLHERTEVLRIAPAIELRPGISPCKDTQNAYPERHKAHFYNMPGLDGETVLTRFPHALGELVVYPFSSRVHQAELRACFDGIPIAFSVRSAAGFHSGGGKPRVLRNDRSNRC